MWSRKSTFNVITEKMSCFWLSASTNLFKVPLM
jgi:hypothetical protein